MFESPDLPVACDLQALTPELREEHEGNFTFLWQRLLERVPTGDGLALRFPNEAGIATRLARFLELEHVCCPFFTLEIRATADDELWLRFTGDADAAEFARRHVPGHA